LGEPFETIVARSAGPPETRDSALDPAQNFANTANNWPAIAWMTGGESLHNNHNTHPGAPKFSMRRFELDPSWLVIRVLAALRQIVITGPPVRLPPDRGVLR
jgi:hypothetical protein